MCLNANLQQRYSHKKVFEGFCTKKEHFHCIWPTIFGHCILQMSWHINWENLLSSDHSKITNYLWQWNPSAFCHLLHYSVWWTMFVHREYQRGISKHCRQGTTSHTRHRKLSWSKRNSNVSCSAVGMILVLHYSWRAKNVHCFSMQATCPLFTLWAKLMRLSICGWRVYMLVCLPFKWKGSSVFYWEETDWCGRLQVQIVQLLREMSFLLSWTIKM